jgi:hypothetical protein
MKFDVGEYYENLSSDVSIHLCQLILMPTLHEAHVSAYVNIYIPRFLLEAMLCTHGHSHPSSAYMCLSYHAQF